MRASYAALLVGCMVLVGIVSKILNEARIYVGAMLVIALSGLVYAFMARWRREMITTLLAICVILALGMIK